jgi:hypothetical protein
MNPDYPLTQKEVDIYQELYYHHYKPLSLKFKDDQEIVKEKMKPLLENYGWTWRMFQDYKSIDMFQRLVFEYSHSISTIKPMTSYPEYRHYDPNHGALRLKSNEFSDDKDVLN